jgi:hypothetical protein
MDAVMLIAEAKRVLKEIRSDAVSPEMPVKDLQAMTLTEAEEETRLSKKTIKHHASALGQAVTGDTINRQLVAQIKERSKKAKLDRAKAGFNASGFKGKKRKAKKSLAVK